MPLLRRREPGPNMRHDPRHGGAPEMPADHGAYGNEVPPGLLRPRNGAGRAALICGVLALICAIGFFLIITVPVAILLGLAAIVLGVMGRSRVRRGIATNRGSATFGILTGLLSLLLLAGLAVGGVALFNSNKTDFKNFNSCAQDAGSNQAKLQKCTAQFKDGITK
ncbi:MAG: hypothetical protein QOC80_596 [Frankiaceae bacterium]|nr:hypothetical protein [Frankiaceae bacterium]MDQ1673690.1 hypothetical protein [Frankiaceae bacterium]